MDACRDRHEPKSDASRPWFSDSARSASCYPGRLLSRHMRCGKTNCRCRLDPPELHGPYLQWNRMVDGKTATRLMPADIADRYQDWFDNAAQLRTTISELETLAVTIVERDRQSRPRR